MARTENLRTEVWQARITRTFAEKLREDAELLDLATRTDIVKAALEMLHRRAEEERMGQSIEEFYQGRIPPLPIGVLSEEDEDAMTAEGSSTRASA
jgi:hypothetical protein